MNRQKNRPSNMRAAVDFSSGKLRRRDEKQVKGLSQPGSERSQAASVASLHQGAGRIVESLRLYWDQHGYLSLLLVAVTLVAYLPALLGQFVWDDDDYVVNNLLLHSLKGLSQIWFAPGTAPQYYPLSFTSFWVDYHLWKLNPLGYHLTNLLFQAINAILLWTLLRRLRVPGAWLAAALFAVHPVNVESVAWITERKNVLAGFFYLSSALACLQFWLPDLAAADNPAQSGPQTTTAGLGNWKCYGLALLLYLCALLAKTATIALPVAVLLVVWWKRGKLGWRALFPLAPFLAVGMAMGLLTVWVEKHFVHAAGSEWTFSFLERCLIAGRAVWFYLGKLVWPHPLMFVYPRWDIDASRPTAYLPVLALMVVLFILWHKRKGWARPMLVALACFLALLFPVLGFFNVYFFRYSFVADHFQYLADIGPLTLAAAGITTALDRYKKSRRFLEPALCGTLLLVLGGLTWQQCGAFANKETLWRTTLAANPDCLMAHNNLGTCLYNEGRMEEAMEHYHKALQINPNSSEALGNLGRALADQGRFDEAIKNYRRAIQISPDSSGALNNLGIALADKGQFDEAIENYYKAIQINPNYAEALSNLGIALAATGRLDEAIKNYRRAIQISPNYSAALNNLGIALARKGQFDEAIENYRQALQINPHYAEALNNLGNALAAGGRLDEAIENYRQALRINPDYCNALDNLGIAFARKGRLDEAIENYRSATQINPNRPEIFFHWGMALGQLGRDREAAAQYRAALRLNPNLTGVLNNLAWLLAASPADELRNGAEAVRLAQRACELTHYGESSFIGTLAAAYAEAGRFDDAVATAQKACALAEASGRQELLKENQELLALYLRHQPYRDFRRLNQPDQPATNRPPDNVEKLVPAAR